MQTAVVTTRLAADDAVAVQDLVAQAGQTRGYPPVSDQFLLELGNSSVPPALSVRSFDGDGVLAAYAQGSVAGAVWTVESVAADDGQASGEALSAVLDASTAFVAEAGGTELIWLVQGPTAQHEAIAAARNLVVARQLHQMRRGLPTGLTFQIDTRSFDPARDIDPWLTVNARAFAWNPEQRNWTDDSVRKRMGEPWFDPAGFLIHEREGRLAGSCWTKAHNEADPALGEIYVIAVDPDFQGLGLGRELTLAGLDHLANRGFGIGMLFVDSENAAGIRLYDRLGFVIHRTDSMFHKTLPSAIVNGAT